MSFNAGPERASDKAAGVGAALEMVIGALEPMPIAIGGDVFCVAVDLLSRDLPALSPSNPPRRPRSRLCPPLPFSALFPPLAVWAARLFRLSMAIDWPGSMWARAHLWPNLQLPFTNQLHTFLVSPGSVTW